MRAASGDACLEREWGLCLHAAITPCGSTRPAVGQVSLRFQAWLQLKPSSYLIQGKWTSDSESILVSFVVLCPPRVENDRSCPDCSLKGCAFETTPELADVHTDTYVPVFFESSFINHSMQRRPVLARRPPPAATGKVYVTVYRTARYPAPTSSLSESRSRDDTAAARE